jgi:UDP-N-acetylmuramoyl-L-alanyl-D-glutamate--2,6-diaminopimelate ligase
MLKSLDQLYSLFPQKNLLLPNVHVTGISYHTDTVAPGHIFVAIPGFRHDGHSYAELAVAKGAIAVIAARPLNIDAPVIIVQDPRVALAKVSHWFFDYPANSINMIGVTASNGKTTTTFMIDHILAQAFPTTGLIGTVIVKDGKQAHQADLTTPQSRDLIEMLAIMRRNGCSHVTMEVSSAGLELERVHGIRYNIAAFNNISREHIDFHGSFENYNKHKSRLIRELDHKALAILNADDLQVIQVKNMTTAQVITYSLKGEEADITISDISLEFGHSSYILNIPRPIVLHGHKLNPGKINVTLKVLGLHNVYNSVVAILAAVAAGVDIQMAACSLFTFGGVERRFQLIYDGQYKIIDDHFANSGNIDISLETMGLMNYNRLILLTAIRGNRGSIVNKENAEAIVRWADKLKLREILVTDSSDFVGGKDLVTDEERKAFIGTLEEHGLVCLYSPDLMTAAKRALQRVSSGDILLLAGPQGMDFGAQVILPMVAKTHSPEQQSEIMQVLASRVAGNILT